MGNLTACKFPSAGTSPVPGRDEKTCAPRVLRGLNFGPWGEKVEISAYNISALSNVYSGR